MPGHWREATYNGGRLDTTPSCADGNDEYRAEGYFLIVKVQPSAVGTPIELQLYDPNFVPTGNKCTSYADADQRHESVRSGRPTLRYGGADDHGGPLAVLLPRRNFDPGESGLTPPQDGHDIHPARADGHLPAAWMGAAITGCTKQYRGYDRDNNGNADSRFDCRPDRRQRSPTTAELARVFHQWVRRCTFTPTRSGDYYLQVRTNVPAFPSASGVANNGTNTPLVYAQNADLRPVRGQPAADSIGFVRAGQPLDGSEDVGLRGRLGAHAHLRERERQWVAAGRSSTCCGCSPERPGRTLEFSIFDAADVVDSGSGTVQVLRPVDATGGQIGVTGRLCTGTRTSTSGGHNDDGRRHRCRTAASPYSRSTHNGELQTISVPIPCRLRLQLRGPAGLLVPAAGVVPGRHRHHGLHHVGRRPQGRSCAHCQVTQP